mgnify:CR=1 FL=1
MEQTASTFNTSRRLPFPPEAIFNAFADAHQLAQWWGPNGFRNTFDIFEFKPGGQWTFVMHGPDGAQYPNQSQFVEINRPRRIVIQHVNAPRFVLTVELQASATGTELTWCQVFEDAAVAAAVRHVVEPANEQTWIGFRPCWPGQRAELGAG